MRKRASREPRTRTPTEEVTRIMSHVSFKGAPAQEFKGENRHIVVNFRSIRVTELDPRMNLYHLVIPFSKLSSALEKSSL